VIVVKVGEKNSSDPSDVDAGFRQTACDAVAGINDVLRPVDNQQIGRLGLVGFWVRAAERPERDETGGRLRWRGARLRHAFVRQRNDTHADQGPEQH